MFDLTSVEPDACEFSLLVQAARHWGTSVDDLAKGLYRHNPVPHFTVLPTATPLDPPPDFTLAAGDVVRIQIQNSAVLENYVVQV